MSRTIRMTVAGALVVAACATALAQQAQTIRVQGTIAKVDGDVLTLKVSDGTVATSGGPGEAEHKSHGSLVPADYPGRWTCERGALCALTVASPRVVVARRGT